MSPDLKSLLHESAPDPSDGPPIEELRRRAGRRRAFRVGSLGVTGVALVVAATAVVMSQPVDLPVPDVVNPQPSEAQPTADPSTSRGEPVPAGWNPPSLHVVGVVSDVESRNTMIIHFGRDGQTTPIAGITSTEESISSLDVAIRGDLLLGTYTSSIGESDDIWWFASPLTGGPATTHERLPDQYQPGQSGGASEIGWPRPVLSSAGVLAYVEAQGTSPDYGGDGYASTIRIVSFGPDSTPSAVASFALPLWSSLLVGHDLESCPFQDEALCLLTIDDFQLREFRITTDGGLDLESPPTSMDPTEQGAPTSLGSEVLDVASTTFSDGTIRRWMITAPREWSLIDVDTRTDETIIDLPFRSPEDTLVWFDVFEDTAVIVTTTRALVVDLETGQMGDGPEVLLSLTDAVVLGTGPAEINEPPEGAQAAADEFIAAWTAQEWDGIEASSEAIRFAQSQPIDETPWVCRSPRDDGIVQCDRPSMGGPNILYLLIEPTNDGTWRVWWASVGHA